MASFNTSGIEGLSLSWQEVEDIPEDVLLEMLIAEGEIVKAAQVRKIGELGLVESHQLEQSITVNKKMRFNREYGGMQRYIAVYPAGVRLDADGAIETVRYKFKRRRGGRTESARTVTNNDVAFIAEYGAPQRGIVPRQWMRVANEESADEAAQAAMGVYNAWMEGLGL